MSSDRRVEGGYGRTRGLAWALWGVGTVCVVTSFLFILASFSVDVPARGFGFRGWVPIVAILWLTIGARIAARQPRISVGWLILGAGFLWALNALFEEYATIAYFPQEIGAPLVPQVVWFDNMVGTAVSGLAGLAMLVIPDGRLLSPRWRPLRAAVILVTVGSVGALAIIPRRLVPFPFDNPFGIEVLREDPAVLSTVLRAIDVAHGLVVILPTIALLMRLRGAIGVQRQQLKWVAPPAAFTALTVLVYAFFDVPIVQYAQLAGLVLIPLSLGVAMRRYRLYDIDWILNRTIVIGGASALVAGLYIAGIGVMQRVFLALTGERSDGAVVLTTLLAAAAFAPLRERNQAVMVRAFASPLPGTRGLDAFVAEVDEHLRLSDRDRLLTQLLAESIESLGATCGHVDVVDAGGARTLARIGPNDDTYLHADVRVRDVIVARVLLGPRANGAVYDGRARRRLEQGGQVVGLALERLDRPLPLAPSTAAAPRL